MFIISRREGSDCLARLARIDRAIADSSPHLRPHGNVVPEAQLDHTQSALLLRGEHAVDLRSFTAPVNSRERNQERMRMTVRKRIGTVGSHLVALAPLPSPRIPRRAPLPHRTRP